MNGTPICEGAEIFTYYKVMAQQKVIGKSFTILKTDLYNESEVQSNNKNILKALSPYIKKGYGIEIDSNIYNEALKVMKDYGNLDLKLGSITELPLFDASIDLILDLSTIDHVKNYEKVIQEYRRVIKPNGEVIIIVWLTDDISCKSYKDQYCFNQKTFEKCLKEYFEIHNQWLLLSKSNDDKRLVEYDLGIPS